MKRIGLFLGLLAGGIGLLAYLSLEANVVYFYTPKEVLEKRTLLIEKSSLRIGGMVLPGSIVREQQRVSFTIGDLEGSNVDVIYLGIPPDMFKESQGVVAEGIINRTTNVFEAAKLFVKHSEEYRVPENSSSFDQEYLRQSLFKNEGT